MLTCFEAMAARRAQARDLVLVSVVQAHGSTPRASGAHMVVDEHGLVAGTIGGGAVEHRALEQAALCLGTPTVREHDYAFNAKDAEALGMVCGGDVKLMFVPLPADDGAIDEAIATGLAALRAGVFAHLVYGQHDGACVLSVVTDDAVVGRVPDELKARLSQVVRARRWHSEAIESGLYHTPLGRLGRAIIIGAGHVGRALAHVLSWLAFDVLVLDDRAACLDPASFDDAVKLKRVDLTRLKETVTFRPDDFVAVMTRGHLYDEQVLAQLLTTPVAYIGAIGSRRKTAIVRDHLKTNHGFSDQDLDRITAPIGLAIGAETPREIAIAIAAQLIDVRRTAEAKARSVSTH